MKSKPNFSVFHKEMCHYFSSLKYMEIKNAMKLYKLVEDLNLTENPSSILLFLTEFLLFIYVPFLFILFNFISLF